MKNSGIGVSSREKELRLSQCQGMNYVLREEAILTVRELHLLLTEDNHWHAL